MTTGAGARSQRAAAGIAAVRVMRMLNEVEAGLRPARQICPLFAVHLRGVIRRMQPRPGPMPELRRLAITTTVPDAYEVVAICHRAGRFTATGLRLSHTGDDWIVTDVARPPSHVATPEHTTGTVRPAGSKTAALL